MSLDPTKHADWEIAEEAETEIEMFRRFSEYYSYGFFVARPGSDR